MARTLSVACFPRRDDGPGCYRLYLLPKERATVVQFRRGGVAVPRRMAPDGGREETVPVAVARVGQQMSDLLARTPIGVTHSGPVAALPLRDVWLALPGASPTTMTSASRGPFPQEMHSRLSTSFGQRRQSSASTNLSSESGNGGTIGCAWFEKL